MKPISLSVHQASIEIGLFRGISQAWYPFPLIVALSVTIAPTTTSRSHLPSNPHCSFRYLVYEHRGDGLGGQVEIDKRSDL